MNTVRDWVTLVAYTLNIVLILFGIAKVWSRNEQEWKMREARLVTIENRITALEVISANVIELRAVVSDLVQEIRRIRDRLDRFLDIQK